VSIGLYHYSQRGNVHWPIAIMLALGGVIGAMVGARLAGKMSGPRLRRAFAVFMMVIGAKMTVDAAPVAFGWAKAAIQQPHLAMSGAETMLAMLLVGVVTGALSGLLGVGGGIVMIPTMVLLLGLPQILAQGISLAVIIPVSISGAMIHYAKGNVDTRVAVWIALGGATGALCGSALANYLDASALRLIFGAFLLVMSVLMYSRKP
jgi:uncharacterized membrane protein YfcA